ncbi:MAG: type II secretion system F family protein [Knoellia sp.]
MTMWIAIGLVIGACALWPARRRPVEVDDERPRLPDGGDVDANHLEVAVPGRATVDEAADALVLCALVLRAGLGPVEALEAVARHVPGTVAHQLRVVASAHRWGQDAATSWAHVGEAWRPAALAWQAAERSGAAPAGVVLAAAERMRREESSRVEAAVQRAGVLLVLPLGACFLPGFVGTTVVPVVLHLARATLGAG